MSDLSAEFVRDILHYDPETGVFTWKVKPCPALPAGIVAGRFDRRGYAGINIQNRKYASHRLAWLYMTGEWPKNQIDHINRNPSDNRISNLRDVGGSENCLNRAHRPGKYSNGRGVSFIKKTGRWQSQISIAGKVTYIGVFATEAEAIAAYEARRALL